METIRNVQEEKFQTTFPIKKNWFDTTPNRFQSRSPLNRYSRSNNIRMADWHGGLIKIYGIHYKFKSQNRYN